MMSTAITSGISMIIAWMQGKTQLQILDLEIVLLKKLHIKVNVIAYYSILYVNYKTCEVIENLDCVVL